MLNDVATVNIHCCIRLSKRFGCCISTLSVEFKLDVHNETVSKTRQISIQKIAAFTTTFFSRAGNFVILFGI